jgi:hypothetical protein
MCFWYIQEFRRNILPPSSGQNSDVIAERSSYSDLLIVYRLGRCCVSLTVLRTVHFIRVDCIIRCGFEVLTAVTIKKTVL